MITYKFDEFQMYEFSSKNPVLVLFFAHANGIPALTYAPLWSELAEQLNIRIICYDMRGVGLTTCPPVYNDQTWGWKILVDDHIKLFERIKKTHPKNTKFVLSGHSLGGWISLLSTQVLGVQPLLIFDPPLLHRKEAFGWFFLNLFKRRNENPKSKKALKRKTVFDSWEAVQESFSDHPFVLKWRKEIVANYIQGSFLEDPKTKKVSLKHAPEWEAHIFAQYPPTAMQGFLQLPKKLRKELKPNFLIGENSDVCNPKAKKWVKKFFPHVEWTIIPKSGHMFLLENSTSDLCEIIKKALQLTGAF